MNIDTIIHGDWKSVVKDLPDESFDAIVTDPPYGVTSDREDYVANDFFNEAYRLLKTDAGLMTFCGQKTLREFWNSAEKAGFKWLNTIVWHYKNTFKRERRRFAIQYDPILYFSKGDFQHNIDAVRVPYLTERAKSTVNNSKKLGWVANPLGAICGDVWEFPAVTNSRNYGSDAPVGHKWQKPVMLFERMILATVPVNGLILDPFVGSGTACVAAKLHNRHYVGIEINEEFYNIAKNRMIPNSSVINNVSSEKDLFA